MGSGAQDLRSDANVTARARGGSMLAWPNGKGKISEKSVRNNIDLLECFGELVSSHREKIMRVPLLVAILQDVADYWCELPEDGFVFAKAKADAKSIKSSCLCIGRLRYRAGRQRDPEVSRIAVPQMISSCRYVFCS